MRNLLVEYLRRRAADLDHSPLRQLARVLPGTFARTLGIDITVAVKWQRASAGDWGAYAAEISRRQGS
ncbi:hypothetical protein ACQEVG_18335 [Streptomyces sp. CA-135486]|uniref:hypothetical protein n=1 Tax=Streptomyces sp. CA-135486 TaxID=3240049 RepID=UPI003D91B849